MMKPRFNQMSNTELLWLALHIRSAHNSLSLHFTVEPYNKGSRLEYNIRECLFQFITDGIRNLVLRV